MLQRLLNVHAVCRLEECLRPFSLSEEDWLLLGRLKTILEIFVRAAEHLSGSSYPTLSVQLPYFVVLASRLVSLIDELGHTDPESDLLYAINEAWAKLDQYHSQTASAQSIATILDPRYKLQTFRNLSWKEAWISNARASIVRIYNDQYAPSLTDGTDPTPDATDLEDDFLEAVFGSLFSTYSVNTPSDLEVYLEEPVEGRKVWELNLSLSMSLSQIKELINTIGTCRCILLNGGEPIHQNAITYPLSFMARDFLAIPATSVPSERVSA